MSLQGPKPWSSILQFNNKTWTDIDRRNIIMDKLEYWSGFNCFYRPGGSCKFKTCRCLESLHGSDGRKNCVTAYLLFWARLDKVPAQMIVIVKLKVLNNVGQLKKTQPFIIPVNLSGQTSICQTNISVRKLMVPCLDTVLLH